MSRGHGQKQRLILRALELCGPFYLAALCDGDLKTTYKAFHRAARRLENEGLLEIGAYAGGGGYGQGVQRVFVSNAKLETVTQYMPLFGAVPTWNVDRKDIKAASERVRELMANGELSVEQSIT